MSSLEISRRMVTVCKRIPEFGLDDTLFILAGKWPNVLGMKKLLS